MVKRAILYDVKIATGIAILLVVIGHLASRGQQGIEMYTNIKSVIYKFHMPLFLFLSGYITHYTFKPISSISDYMSFVRKKALRLFPAYIILSFVFLTGKFVIKYNSGFLLEELGKIMIYPSLGSSGFLWYIYVLFMFNLFMPIINKIFQHYGLFFFVFISSCILSFFSFPDLFALNFFFWYLPFFLLGGFMSKKREAYCNFIKSYGVIFLIVFVVWFSLEFLGFIDTPKLISGLISIVTIHYISIKLSRNVFFEYLGDNSFNIYLFNTLFIGGFIYVAKKVFNIDVYSNVFYIMIPFLVFIGIFFPIKLYTIINSKFPSFARLIH
jgi:fucose 4-O-acetylase-like acetyltransferase